MPQVVTCGFCLWQSALRLHCLLFMKLKIGRVLKAQGIKGEIKAICLLDDAAMLQDVKKLYLNNNPHTVESFRAAGNFFYVRFSGISDRNAAENLRGFDIFCDKEIVSLPNDRYFVEDIVGCRVTLDDGRYVGEVCDVLQYGAADVYVCKSEKGEVSFPVLKDLVISVNVQLKQVKLVAKRFAEVALDSFAEEVRDED